MEKKKSFQFLSEIIKLFHLIRSTHKTLPEYFSHKEKLITLMHNKHFPFNLLAGIHYNKQ